MKRRNFIHSSIGASLVAGTAGFTHSASSKIDAGEREWYEIRIYNTRFGGNANLLLDYLQNSFKQEMLKRGARDISLFNELGLSDPRKIWCFITYPDSNSYLECQMINSDESFIKANPAYHGIDSSSAVYDRFESWLLLAFEGMPQMLAPKQDAGLFELRTYEGYSEDAVRRKIKMFNVEEITLFHKTGLYPVLFGEMVAGPHRPSLTYMLNFKDMEQRNSNWQQFIQHPEWIEMRAREEYANSVSHIHKTFLTPLV